MFAFEPMRNWEVVVPYCDKNSKEILGYIFTNQVVATSKDEAYYRAYKMLKLWGDEQFIQFPCYKEPYLGVKVHKLIANKMKARRW